MKLIFDEKKLRSYGEKKDPNNTPDILVQRMNEQLKILGEFVGADSVQYIDGHKAESYILTKGDKILELVVCGNGIDGGWMLVDVRKVAEGATDLLKDIIDEFGDKEQIIISVDRLKEIYNLLKEKNDN